MSNGTPSYGNPTDAFMNANWLPWPRKPLGKFSSTRSKGPVSKQAHGPKTRNPKRKTRS